MKFRLCSDVHYEMGVWEIDRLPDDKDTVMVLAGDVGVLKKPYTYEDFIAEACDRFRRVIWVYGNHEFYHGSWPYSGEKAEELFAGVNNLSCGHEFEVVIDDTAFVCSTLWSDFFNADPLMMYDCSRIMNDYRIVRTGSSHAERHSRRLIPENVLSFFRSTTKGFLRPAIKRHKEAGRKVVVVTHHAPSLRSIHDDYRHEKHNGAYASDLDDLILELEPDVWCHGHVHNSFDYMIGKTRVVCNPVGYPGYRNPNLDATLTLEV